MNVIDIQRHQKPSWRELREIALPAIYQAVDHAEKMNAIRWSGDLPTLTFVPHIKLTSTSKYRMEDRK